MRAVFLDIEATGLDVRSHSPIDIAFKIIDLTVDIQEQSYQALICPSEKAWQCRDFNSMQVNGYTWEQLQQGKDIAQVSREIIEIFALFHIERGRALFICQNPAFDRGFFSHIVDPYLQDKLHWPYHWLDLASMYWIITMLRCHTRGLSCAESVQLSKNAIAQSFSLPPEVEPHRALNGVEHLIICYKALLNSSLMI